MIPAVVVSVFAFVAVFALMTVRPMPWRMRVSMSVPHFYFGCIYAWASFTPLDAITRTEAIRIGLLLIFLGIIMNSVLARWQWAKKRKQ
jgi:hypothetical protein